MILTTLIAASSLVIALPQEAVQAPTQTTKFAPPVLLMVGDKPMGQGLMFPSPELRDIDCDGHADLLLGDLRGNLHLSMAQPGAEGVTWAKTKKFEATDGKPIEFHNW